MFNDNDIEKIQAKIVGDYPLFSNWVFGTKVSANEFIKTLQVNSHEILYNPAHMEKTSPVDRVFKLMHEYGHLFLDHPRRLTKRRFPDEKKRQEAADYEVNDILADFGLDLPWDAIWSPRFTGMAAEEIYKLLKEEPRSNDKDYNPNSHGDCQSQEDVDQQKAAMNGEEPPPPPTEQEQQQAEDEHRQKQLEAIQQAKMMGSLPAGIKRRLDRMTESKTDWHQALPDAIEDLLGADDYTFAYPDRRYDCDFILPGMVGKRQGIYGLAVDTSISVGKDILTKMGTEVMDIIQQNEPEITYVLWCDTRVKDPQIIHNTDPFELKPVGGGGTDFRPPFAWLEKHQVVPKIMLYLTDGYCSYFAPEPDYPVVWVVWGDNRGFKPPYGRVILM